MNLTVTLGLSLLLLFLWPQIHPTHADRPSCVRNVDCESFLMKGSICVAGVCSNPFYERGCFQSIIDTKEGNDGYDTFKPAFPHRTRVCNSEDTIETMAAGYCQAPDTALDYKEIRIVTQNWESVFVEAWMLQILLQEFTGVPVTLETGSPDVNLDFYHPELTFGWGTGNDWPVIENSVKIHSDCRQVPRTIQVTEQAQDGSVTTKEVYQPCAHMVPEVWATQSHNIARLQQEQIIEGPMGLGVIGQQAWFIPRFAAEKDPTLLTYFGLAGGQNRRKLAETFKRPTTWGDYCDQVSPTKCQMPDGVASRLPLDDLEAQKYFAGVGAFTGHFRMTDESDCDAHPDRCTGHIADYPCGWSSFVEQQAFHLDIALRSSGTAPGCRGYTYGELTQIAAAANATRSPIVMQWWTPDALYQTYSQTYMEFQAISLPPPKQQCMEATVTPEDRCHEDQAVRVGEPEGACAEPPYPLQKVVSVSLFEITEHPSIPPAKRNPAYEIIKAFQLTALELGEIFDAWLNHDSPAGSAFTLRHATCEWMVGHWDKIHSWIPREFPRVAQKAKDTIEEPLGLATVIIAWVTAFAVILTIATTYAQRSRPVIRHAQVGFLWIILLGLFLVSAGSLISVAPPSNLTCAASTWFINLGYTLEVVPLIVKAAAIQHMVNAAKKARRVVVDMNQLYAAVAGISSLVVLFLLLWTILDIPSKDAIYTLSSDQTRNGETIVWVGEYCQSESNIWRYSAAIWHSLLLVAASVFAFSTRKIKTDFNENQSLSLMVYSHAIFVLLRILTFSLEFGEGGETDAVLYRSLVFSCDTLATIGIYFVSKFLSSDNQNDIVDLRTSQLQLSQHTHSNIARNSTNPIFKKVSTPIPSIMEVQRESDSEENSEEEFAGGCETRKAPIEWKAAPGGETHVTQKSGIGLAGDEDSGLEDRLTSYIASQTTAGLRCRHCGKYVSESEHC